MVLVVAELVGMMVNNLMRLMMIFLTIGLVIVSASLAQETPPDDLLTLSVAGQRCGLIPIETQTPEVTPEPDDEAEVTYPIISLGEDCESVIPQLVVSSNGTLWLAIQHPEEEDWQQFEVLEEDEYPPQLDKRGRYIGCRNPNEGNQTCSVLWEMDEETYLIEIPIFVGSSYIAPTSTAQPTAMPQPQTTVQASSNNQQDAEPTATATKKKEKDKGNDNGGGPGGSGSGSSETDGQ